MFGTNEKTGRQQIQAYCHRRSLLLRKQKIRNELKEQRSQLHGELPEERELREKRTRRLSRGDMITDCKVSVISGLCKLEIHRAIENQRLLGLYATSDMLRLPKWQFEPQFVDLIPQLFRALDTEDAWDVLEFLDTPLPELGHESPLQHILCGKLQGVLEVLVTRHREKLTKMGAY